jgi:hypothetical protein
MREGVAQRQNRSALPFGVNQCLSSYHDYISDAYFWLLIGILFKLPEILAATTPAVVPARTPVARGGFEF